LKLTLVGSLHQDQPKTSPSSLVSKSEKNNFLCLGGEDSRAWAISDDDNFFNRLLISSCESSEELSNN
jgi:hypothetical protein